MKCLIKNFTRQKLTDIRGPVTIVSGISSRTKIKHDGRVFFFSVGRKRRITFIECRNDINSMIDVAKIADLVSWLIFLLLNSKIRFYF
jgi:ribosome biogenesis protein BMS1